MIRTKDIYLGPVNPPCISLPTEQPVIPDYIYNAHLTAFRSIMKEKKIGYCSHLCRQGAFQ